MGDVANEDSLWTRDENPLLPYDGTGGICDGSQDLGHVFAGDLSGREI